MIVLAHISVFPGCFPDWDSEEILSLKIVLPRHASLVPRSGLLAGQAPKGTNLPWRRVAAVHGSN